MKTAKNWARAASVATAAFLAACVPRLESETEPAARALAVPVSSTSVDVPYAEPATDLGAIAATASVLAYYDRPMAEARLALLETDPTRELPGAIAEAVWETDLHGYLLTDMEWVLTQLSQGRPSLVRLREEDGEVHYAVLVGYDLAAGVVYLHGPRGRAAPMEIDAFQSAWYSGGWNFLVLPPDVALGHLIL